MPYGLSQFWLTVVKLYYKDNSSEPLQDVLKDILDDVLKDVLKNILKDILKDILKNILKDVPEDVLEENYNQCALKGNYNSDTIVVDILQL